MNNLTIQLKVQERLNKLASSDYDNIECWLIVEAFNKGQVQWCRRQLHGSNMFKEGDEQSKRRIDDLQILLNDSPNLVMTKKDILEFTPLPTDYMEWKRVSAYATSDCCSEPRRMKIWQVEEGNIDDILRDFQKRPNFDWGETVCTLKDNNLLIYTNGEFTIDRAVLTYYRQPRLIQIATCADAYTGAISGVEVTCEFKDDIVELMIDEAVAILAGDIEAGNQFTRNTETPEKNN
jgi:hypothetical protein